MPCIRADVVCRVLFALSIALAFYPSLPASAAPPVSLLSTGIAFYEKHDYAKAADSLRKAVNSDPYNAISHYYLANSYLQLGDRKNAASEYFTCFDLDPFGQAGQYSRDALKQLGGASVSGGSSAANPGGGLQQTAPDSGASIRNAVGSIGRQTTEKGKFNQASSQICARLVSDNATIYATRVSQSAEELVAELRESHRGHLPEGVEDELQEIRQKALFKAAWIREDAQRQANRRIALAKNRSELVENSATNLMSLIAENPQAGHVKLKAAGTNLYVRNYAMDPLPKPEPLKAEWQLLPQAENRSERKRPRSM